MRVLPFIFSIILFGSAALSFSVQPILGKMLLPVVGGAPAGWIVAMTFFQLALLAGYGVSYILGRFSPWVHATGLVGLYVAGWSFLPFSAPQFQSSAQGIELSLQVIEILFKLVFVPFLALTATTSALQRIFAATKHTTAKDPYYLFVASNIGSFLGLLLYPFVLEPYIGISTQASQWKNIYSIVAILIGFSIVLAWAYRSKDISKTTQKKITEKTTANIFMWLALSFVPCSLSMGVTTMITTDLSGFPLFWVLPLGLYLLTFVLAFATKKLISRDSLTFWHHCSVVLFSILSIFIARKLNDSQVFVTFVVYATILLSLFFMIAWSCHDRLASLRPPTDKLPLYYFVLALGGALAGLVHTFIIPYAFNGVYEFSIMVAMSLFLSDHWSKDFSKINTKLNARRLFIVCAFLLALASFLIYSGLVNNERLMVSFGYAVLSVFMVIYLLFSLQPKVTLVFTSFLILMTLFVMNPKDILFKDRNFFGTFSVTETRKHEHRVRHFAHGTTLHGMAVFKENGELLGDSFGYYLKDGPIQDVMKVSNVKHFAVLGLGTGQLACFAGNDVQTDFFEIDQDILTMAKNFFPYLDRCPPRKVFIGDGRLEIANTDHMYDVILQDAFTSDGIPTHLLTVEAFKIYKHKLAEHGIILFHISNRYFDLAPVIAATANKVGLKAYTYTHLVNPKKEKFRLPSRWVAVAKLDEDGKALQDKGWKLQDPHQAKPWTDDRSSLIEAIKIIF